MSTALAAPQPSSTWRTDLPGWAIDHLDAQIRFGGWRNGYVSSRPRAYGVEITLFGGVDIVLYRSYADDMYADRQKRNAR